MELDRFFAMLAAEPDDLEGGVDRAPGRLKSRIYSALVRRQASTGPLLSLSGTKAAGHGLCVFESAVCALPGDIKTSNPCSVCHARILAERLDVAPIFWPHCPYSEFHRG